MRRLGGERGRERRAVAVGTLERGDQRWDPGGGRAALELRVGVLAWHAERGVSGGARELVREHAGMAATDLGERAAR